MKNADFLNAVDKCMKQNGIELYGFCPFVHLAPLIECRAKERLPEKSATVIVCAFPYLVKENDKRNLSYYACVKDYHKVVTSILANVSHTLSELTEGVFEPFSDNSPIHEVDAAVKAGIGVLGDNGLLITKKYGSYVFIGEIVTDIEIDAEIQNSSCLHCGMCSKKCPSKALCNGEVNEEICVSSISQKKGELNSDEKELIRKNGLVWGCDICQMVCPMNINAAETNIDEFKNTAHHFLKSEEVSERIKESAYNWRGKKTILRNLEIYEQN